ncbi:MAG: bifunctional aspartate kinase/homoserine dehydrogenase I [Ignavibacteriaceae bacterium]
MKVLKFGGSSVGDSERIKNVINIIKKSYQDNGNVAVIFSAFHGITDELIKVSQQAARGSGSYETLFQKIETRHIQTAKELISVKSQSRVLANLKLNLNELEDVLHGVYLVKELSARTLDFIMSFGERFSAYIISEAMKDRGVECEYLDSRTVIKTDESFGSAKVNFEITNDQIKSHFSKHNLIQAITGFIGSTSNEETTTLGRGGSDYTASIFAAALEAEEIEIWSDVDGVLTADPRKVKKAFSIPSLTYEEAMELSHFGAKVIHPPTMQPALNKRIPIRIKNTFNPDFEGSLVSSKSSSNSFLIKGISSIDEIALLTIQGSGMVGVTGIAQRIFGALAVHSINVILITQASSEHSLCIAVLPGFAASAKKAIEHELRFEIKEKLVNQVHVENNLSIIAVVGENMRETPGISGRIFQALGRNGINIVAIAQGSSELNISAVISKANQTKALTALHDAFFLSITKTVNIFVVGVGLIGGTLLKQIQNQVEFLQKEYSLSIRVIGLANSRKMLIDENGIDPGNWKEDLNSRGEKTDLHLFIDRMNKLNLPYSIFADCTASENLVDFYLSVLNSSVSIVTPNKKANSRSYEFYLQLRETALKHNVRFLYETNVGAGLPIIGTIKDLVSSGDRVFKIEGVLSGTLSFIFNTVSAENHFSGVVKEARQKGYTEPDPREDLNGMDVARKLLVLAREVGMKMELSDMTIQNLVPPAAANAGSVDEFFEKLKSYDEEFENRRKKLESEGKVLRYMAKLENGHADISLQEVGQDHPFYSLSANDNILALTTLHYQARPIVIKGPGAGADVTAAGVFADIIRIANYLS